MAEGENHGECLCINGSQDCWSLIYRLMSVKLLTVFIKKSSHMAMVGVTGTNGKSSCTWFHTRSLLVPCGKVGTLVGLVILKVKANYAKPCVVASAVGTDSSSGWSAGRDGSIRML